MNKLITLDELSRSFEQAWIEAAAQQDALHMFIDGQYNWERPEFDEHG